jgi:glycosyltransferase involved in cell wall biosynthesis
VSDVPPDSWEPGVSWLRRPDGIVALRDERVDVRALLDGELRQDPQDAENIRFVQALKAAQRKAAPRWWKSPLVRRASALPKRAARKAWRMTRRGLRLALSLGWKGVPPPPVALASQVTCHPSFVSHDEAVFVPPPAGQSIVAWVIPWYGDNIPGGAEAQCRATARHLARAGHRVEILTTCVREFQSDWSVNHHAPGVETVDGITIRRFPVEPREAAAFDRINARLMRGERVGSADERVFMRNMIRSEALVAYMREHRDHYVFLPIPYMFGTTLEGALACPERTVLVPCLHDEAYAYMECFGEMFRAVRGAIYHAPAEKRLAERLYGLPSHAGAVVGGGIDEVTEASAARFHAKYGRAPFLLYAGRKDSGKNVPLLVDYFCHYKNRFGGKLRLILIGNGDVEIPIAHRNRDVLDLGFVSRQEKHDAYAAALALCQPSLMESFSIVTLEAWTAGCPALVHRDCEVTREHCEASQGGLAFGSFAEFAACLRYWERHPDLRARMGRNGAEYVRRNFTWGPILEKYLATLNEKGFELV